MKYYNIFVLASVIKALARPAQDVLVFSTQKPRPSRPLAWAGEFVVVPSDLHYRDWDL